MRSGEDRKDTRKEGDRGSTTAKALQDANPFLTVENWQVVIAHKVLNPAISPISLHPPPAFAVSPTKL